LAADKGIKIAQNLRINHRKSDVVDLEAVVVIAEIWAIGGDIGGEYHGFLDSSRSPHSAPARVFFAVVQSLVVSPMSPVRMMGVRLGRHGVDLLRRRELLRHKTKRRPKPPLLLKKLLD
jgi:hypothetical protein